MAATVNSSTTLWAQASKEWVIPAKPKPGRKPKKDPPPPVCEGTPEPDAKGRRVQNRAAQRAFRERKQSQLADLQARVQSYEQGEIERNVALQNIAKRLKDENESLRKENTALREELRKLRPEGSPETERKRWREDSLQPYSSNDFTSRKRMKTDQGLQLTQDTMSLMHSPSSMVSSPADSSASSGQHDTYSPMSFGSRSPNSQVYSHTQQPAMASLFSGFVGKAQSCMNENRSSFDHSFGMVDCGFCPDDTACMCRELALQQVGPRIAVHDDMPGTTPSISTNTTSAQMPPSPPEVKMESRGSISISSTPQITPQMTPASIPIQSMNGSSILDNLPAYAPAVPLPRRRAADQAPPTSIFPVYPVQSVRSTRASTPNCTGDPSNCMACADDPFGKAFCAALGSSVKQCNGSTSNSGFGCGGCGNPSCGASSSSESASAASSPDHSSETVPCNTAWAQLKSHPNIAFTDLTMLAEVVARRSKCTGPVLSSEPELDALTRRQSDGRTRGADDMPVLLTDPHAQYHEHAGSQSGSPLQHGLSLHRQRVLEVQAEGVRDALALLDGQFQRS
ncbi:hypothetical protein M422DRAFT_779186 [Sphaerobolus stellatus SS14]|uniref:BZIP domain-containing protein n=1 Tax=Sphaerobolus stellatus (strain SS14) TaxID=990650 RepID=A0A0C9VS53_SPHS4|nr:hypothetical protein M422DRAFT_779186 [Sphaerobolus stellatus SS14]